MPLNRFAGVLTKSIWQAVQLEIMEKKVLLESHLYGMQRAVKYSKPWKDIPIGSIPFVGVPTENIWQAVQGIKPLRFGEQSKSYIYKVKENERSTCFCIYERSFCFFQKTTDNNQRTMLKAQISPLKAQIRYKDCRMSVCVLQERTYSLPSQRAGCRVALPTSSYRSLRICFWLLRVCFRPLRQAD